MTVNFLLLIALADADLLCFLLDDLSPGILHSGCADKCWLPSTFGVELPGLGHSIPALVIKD